MEMPRKYLEREHSPCYRGDTMSRELEASQDWTAQTEWRGHVFREGSGVGHACYLTEMSFKHPIMYFCFYRWWIPTLLTPNERRAFDELYQWRHRDFYRPYWAEFSSHHPVQFLLLFIVFVLFQSFIKLLTAPVKAVHRVFKVQGPTGGAGAGHVGECGFGGGAGNGDSGDRFIDKELGSEY